MNLRVVILPAKALADGTHKIRIAISHRGQTRYFVTRFVVPNEECIKNGTVVGVSNASYINQQLRIRMNNIYTICDQAEDLEYYSCSQLVKYIEHKEYDNKPKTFHEIAEKFIKTRSMTHAESTMKMYLDAVNVFETFVGEGFVLRDLTHEHLFGWRKWMQDERSYTATTISIKEKCVHTIINYAVKLKYVQFEVSPYVVFTDLKPTVRECHLTIEQLRTIRDLQFNGRREYMLNHARDIFMLSFYLCGMNLVDIMETDFSGDTVKYRRRKTRTRKDDNAYTEFTIQPEARSIIDRLFVDGKVVMKHERTYNGVSRVLRDCLPRIAAKAGIDSQFVFYSARKTFAQIANELYIKDSVIEYCIGDTVTQSQKVIGYYVNVNKRMADKCIRKVFDAVASTKSIEELTDEIMNAPFI